MISSRFTAHSLVTEVHKTLQCYQPTPNISIDATMGNGHDTLFLSRCSKKVYAFDIQAIALQHTQIRLQKEAKKNTVHLIKDSHENILHHLNPSEKIDIALFNLGYLPHGNPNIITQSQHSIKALNACSTRMNIGAIISILAYAGHSGGQEEMHAIQHWCQHLNPKHFHLTYIHSMQETARSPRLFIIQAY